jgi:hypothetical protein
MKDIIFPYYDADITHHTPLGYVSLEYLLNAIKNPKKDIKHIFEQIMIADENKDVKLKQELKTKLYSFNPCVFIEGKRKYDNIKHFTGLLMLDFDKMESVEYAKEFKEYLFNKNKFIISSWLSASKRGVRAVVKIPVCTSVDEFKHYFNAIERELNCYNGFDPAPKNCVLPLFISYDPEILTRTDYTTWKQKYIPLEKPPVIQYIVSDKTNVIEKIILNRINTITDSGHSILRATAYLLGGYVGAGYVDYNYSIQMINNMIDSHHYLSQKGYVYKKTAKTMIDKGINQPTYLQNL